MKTKEEIEKEYYTDKWDVIKTIIKPHSNDLNITEDYILFKSDDKTEKFIKQHYKIAMRINDFIKEPTIGKNTSQFLLSEINIMATIKRNNKDNWLIKKIIENINETNEQKEEEDNRTMIEKLLNTKKDK